MHICEYRGFTIEVYKSGEGYVSQIYRKGKLIHTIHDKIDTEGQNRNPALLVEAARDWIDRMYPRGKIKYFGEV